ncbi:MAG: OB-fold nucleic acid binding domain-containing protein [Candidatus Aenigmarchaeota archaeon]|nr:OB-fold nucleic acid binding domain-containing protein [Candidatus Aenigmarchaeota archaeon]MDW8149403.1 OB-fold nucleic acid binding domain-containing protein [Candidatus Aenigmarchaeota archaeon]
MEKEEIIKKILEKTNYKTEEIEKKAEEKRKLFKDFISEKGIYLLVARELGIDIEKNFVEIKNLINGMKNVSFIGRIFKISEIKEIRSWKVANIFIGDNTGYIKIPLWNEQCEILKTIKVGDVVEVNKAYVKENVYGDIEVSLGRFSSIRVLNKNNINLPTSEELFKLFFSKSYKKCKINEINSVGNYEIEGTVTKIIKTKKFLYNYCDVCSAVNCDIHTNSNLMLIFSLIIDDGYGNIRCVFFESEPEKIIKMNELSEENILKEIRRMFLGKDFLIRGKVKKSIDEKNFEIIVHYCENL